MKVDEREKTPVDNDQSDENEIPIKNKSKTKQTRSHKKSSSSNTKPLRKTTRQRKLDISDSE